MYVVLLLSCGWYISRSGIFLKLNHAPLSMKEQTMSEMQERRRIDVERFFGVLQGRFRILRADQHM